MSLLKNKWFWIFLLGVLVSGGLLLVVVGYFAVVVLSGLLSGTSLLALLIDIAVPFVVGVGLLLVLLALCGVGLIWSIVRAASVPRSERLVPLAERLEREYPPLRAIGLTEVLSAPEPTPDEQAEQALADLKQQYVNGEISEAEFERKVDRLVATESLDEARAASERNQVIDDQ